MNFYSKLDIKQINNNNMKMKTTTKRFLILFVAVMAMMVNVNAEKVPYAKLSGSTLTFQYGELTTGTFIFDLSNENFYENLNPIASTVMYVKIEPSFAEVRFRSCSHLFYNMENLQSIAGLQYLNTSEVTNMLCMFAGCKNLKTIDVSGFNTSKVTNMKKMFFDCNRLENVDVSSFNTPNVTDMTYMFGGCDSLKTVDVSGFNTSSVTGMGGLFSGCDNLETIDVGGFNTSNVTSMKEMFDGCKSLKAIDVSGFNTSNVTNMGNMFDDCSRLENVDVSGFNTSNVTDMSYMFRYCSGLTNLDVSGFNTSNVTDMSDMFYGCEKLSSLDVSAFNTSNVTDMSGMFYECKSLASLNVSSFNTSNVANMRAMFANCSGLTNLDVSGFNTSNVTDMSSMFYYCIRLTSLDLRNFNTSNVTNMNSMFNASIRLKIIDVRNFNTSKVTNMGMMFAQCDSLTTIYCNDSWSCNNSSHMFMWSYKLKGAISYNETRNDATYANPETGYFTYKDYDLWVNGTQVTHTNYNNLSVINGVNGTVKFDNTTQTLILDNATITAANNTYAISSNLPCLRITVMGDNTLTSATNGGIRSNGSLELSGSGSSALSVSGTSALVMTSVAKNHLNITDLNLTFDGTSYYGVLSSNNSTVMEIQGDSEVKTKGVRECYSGLKDIIIPEGYEVIEPTGAYISGGKVLATDGSSVKEEWVTIGPKGYGLEVGGIPVTIKNKGNITGSNIKQGTASYDDETKTLTLTDCSIGMDYTTGTIGIKSSMDSLAIHLVGNNSIGMVDTGIESTGDVTIAGPGKLGFVICNTGIYMAGISAKDLAITDGAKLDMTLVGTGILGQTLKVTGTTRVVYRKNLRVSGGMSDVNIVASTSAISDMNKLVLNDGLSLTAPVGAKFENHAVCDKDGNVVKGKNVRFSLAGDVNNDGAVTMADANAVVNYFLATDKPSSFDVDNANVNGDADDDGKPSITMADANAIVNMFLGQ